MKRGRIPRLVWLVPVLLFLAPCLVLPGEALAKAEVVALEGMSYNVNASLQDNLKSLVGKYIHVTLDSGKTYSGSVKEVGNHFMHLEKLQGKDFFDALIRIESISAVEAKFRDFQR
jgi:hypothetical protein